MADLVGRTEADLLLDRLLDRLRDWVTLPLLAYIAGLNCEPIPWEFFALQAAGLTLTYVAGRLCYALLRWRITYWCTTHRGRFRASRAHGAHNLMSKRSRTPASTGMQVARMIVEYVQIETETIENREWHAELHRLLDRRQGIVVGSSTRRATEGDLGTHKRSAYSGLSIVIPKRRIIESDDESETPTECDTCFPMTDCVCASQAN